MLGEEDVGGFGSMKAIGNNDGECWRTLHQVKVIELEQGGSECSIQANASVEK